MSEQHDPLPGWESLDSGERSQAVDQAFQYIHTKEIYRSRWDRLTRWWPWWTVAFFYSEVRVPDPSITFDVGLELGTSDPPWSGSVKDFYERALEAFRSLTVGDRFIYAVDTDNVGYRFSPHDADPTARWALGIPGATNWSPYWESFLMPPNFSWVFHARQTYEGELVTGERITLSGDALLDAFERHRPQLFSRTVVEEQRPPPTYADAADVRQADATMESLDDYHRRQEARPSQVRHKRARKHRK